MEFSDSSNSENNKGICNRKARGSSRYLKELNPIPADPAIDPEFGSCFNCWEFGHLFQQCVEPKRCFCHNCGRIGVRVDNCPRCCQAHQKYFKDIRDKNLVLDYSEDFTYQENQVEGEDNKIQYKYFSTSENFQWFDSFSHPNNEKTEDSFSWEEEENYNDIIVDENQMSSHAKSDLVVDFLSLHGMIKHLPIETQNVIFLRFVKECCRNRKPEIKNSNVFFIDRVKSYFSTLINFVRTAIQKLFYHEWNTVKNYASEE